MTTCPPDLAGKRIEDAISKPEVAHLVAVLLEFSRKSGERISVPYRTDGDDESRLIEMAVSPGNDDGEIELRSRRRRSGRLQAPALSWESEDGYDGMLRICSVCHRIEEDSEWKTAAETLVEGRLFERPKIPRLSHGLCPDCYARSIAEIEKRDG
ncbi:MAG: hypothetical protein ACNS61_08585 [Candidatus Wenzhouxiangella sp. M2_3B_020]